MTKSHLLICDDDRGIRESYRLILEEEYQLTFANNGEEAIHLIREVNPDMVILDIKMPKKSGLEALVQIRRLKPKIGVLIVSGYESTDVAAEALELGADDYLTKPFDRHTVWDKVQSILQKRK